MKTFLEVENKMGANNPNTSLANLGPHSQTLIIILEKVTHRKEKESYTQEKV